MPRLVSGRYRLIERVREGGTSFVWSAHDEILRRRVAVRLLAAKLHDDGRLQAATQAAAALSHPNVRGVYDFGVAGNEAFIVMELVDGIPLADRLTRGPLPWRGAVEVCAYVAAALSAAHARGLAHGGITPETIMLTGDGVKVVDFGIASLVRARAGDGRSAYVAPERRAGPTDHTRDQAADVYAIGVVLFTALTGHPPVAVRAGLRRDNPEPVPLPLIPGMPLEVAALYQRCLAAEPAMRPSAAALAHRLAALVGVRVGAVDVRVVKPSDDETANLRGTRELPTATDFPAATEPAPLARSGRLRKAVVGGAVAVAVVFAGTATASALMRSGGSSQVHWSAGSDGPGSGAAASSRPGSGAPTGRASSPSTGAGQAAAGSCTVAYQVKQTWDNGATVSLSITNTGRTGLKEWALSFDVEGQVQTGSSWNGAWQQQGTQVTVTGLAGHSDLEAGASVTDVGANVGGQHAGTIPDAFVLNGMRCQTATQP
ncbi:serine/threonine-protein kinase [Dactylosporangium sp. McL0621]|uniref:serine/threonine-protein kinase n=1 Tax=Dactylosporangium sp. McL0621 TaxID=3415678 RepID=UPI003CEEE264